MHRAWCLALVHSLGYVCAFEDAAALIQQQQFVAALETESSVQKRAEVLPDPGSRGYRFSRVSHTEEAGGSAVVNFSHFCETHDAFGPQACTVYFGMPVKRTAKVHLDTGFAAGDIFSSTWDVQLTHNTSSMWSFLVPKILSMTSACALCDNSCDYSMSFSKYTMNVKLPTTLDSAGICSNSGATPQQDYVFEDEFSRPLSVLEDVALDGTITHGFGVKDQDGNTRAFGNYLYTYTPGLGSAATALAAESRPKVLLMKGSAEKRVFHPREMFMEVLLPQMLEPSDILRKKVGLPKPVKGRKQASASHALGLSVVVKKMPAGSHISLAAASGCSTVGSNITCQFPATGTISVTSSMSIAFLAETGSTMRIASQLSAAGPMGLWQGNATKRNEIQAPLCGSSPITVTDLKGKNRTYQPTPCGRYNLTVASLAPHVQQLADFADLPLPQANWLHYPTAPKTLNQLLPISQKVEVELKHSTGQTFLNLELAISLLSI